MEDDSREKIDATRRVAVPQVFSAIVNSGDNLQSYKAYFDGNGTINDGDNLQFCSQFNKILSWIV